jgi:hypothetical protein
MKERPILFSAPMVKAIIAGHKTQTRRVVKPSAYQKRYVKGSWGKRVPTMKEWNLMAGDAQTAIKVSAGKYECPYGQPGERLWVRETWACRAKIERVLGVCYRADEVTISYPDRIMELAKIGTRYAGNWRPSIFMPRWASRITLEIAEVRVERVQDISEADAKAEGMASVRDEWMGACGDFDETLTHKQLYEILWDSINGKAHPWSSNPWVWVVGFRKLP